MKKRKYELVPIKKLKPYGNNARTHSDKQIEKIVRSIEEFGFINPVIIDSDCGIIAGHGRVMAAQKMGIKELPCIYVEDLDETQKRAYILADNKLALDAGWDEELLRIELDTLKDADFDISITGFDFDVQIPDVEIEDEDDEEYGAERLRTDRAYNLDLMGWVEFTNNFWQMPIIENDGFIPKDLTGFNYAKSLENKNTGIHFFVDDYQFERVWNYPEKYVDILSEYDCILSPDFSLYMDMPMPMKIWNIYRSRQIGAYYQSQGIKVIPTISWAEPETFEFCFQGIPKGSIVAISTVGVKEDATALEIWTDGVTEMIKQIEPSVILIYGGKLDYDYGDIQTVYYDNQVLENWKKKE